MEDLINAIAKLRWAENGDWSTALTPAECKALLAVVPADAMVIKTLDAKDEPRSIPTPLNGYEDDEHQ